MFEVTDEKALNFHAEGQPGKFEIRATKPLRTEYDLALAYTPGVAVPVAAIATNPDLVYRYTNKGNMVAVISNGTAVLGLGDLGPLASKPVMEGKCVLFKRFAGLDSVDIEVDTADPEKFINCVRYLGPAFGGINLEDIKAPDSLIIEAALKALMDVPVFHDDQHGTAVVVAAGLLNALEIAGKPLKEAKMVVAGAGSAAMAVIDLIISLGMPLENILVCDEAGVLNQDRCDLDRWRQKYVRDTSIETLSGAMRGGDIAIGLSASGVFTTEMVNSMSDRPIIFALANPVPEILPAEIKSEKPDAIIATGRSDFPNQVNNVLCFPFIFRGALDVQATMINEAMKIAAARALAKLAQSADPVLEVGAAPVFGEDHILPSLFDSRLNACVSSAVAAAAMQTGVAQQPIADFMKYRSSLMEMTASLHNAGYSTKDCMCYE